MSQKQWTIIGGAAAAIALVAVLAFGLTQGGDKVSGNAAVPGDDTAQTPSSEDSGSERVESAEEPAQQPAGGDAEPLPKGPDLPPLTGQDLMTGTAVNIAEQGDGKPLVIQMWASWCEVCDETADEVKKFVDNRKDIAYVGIDVQDEIGPGRAFSDKHGWTHTSVFDDGTFAQTFGLRGTPTYIFVHADGKIAGQSVGDPGYEGLNRIADRLIASS